MIVLCGCATKQTFYIGEQYLGAKYKNNPLGEEKLPDNDPLIRTDVFDCMTFVETVLAHDNVDKLTKIRYKNGDIDFINRNHFVETDWLKNNANIIKNVSYNYGKTDIRTVKIDKKSWFKKMYQIDTDFNPEIIDLEYIPYTNITNIKNDETLVVLFVTDNPTIAKKIGTDLAITHVGFLLPNGTLRHASREQGHVVDVNFNEYIKQKKQNKNNIGIMLLEIK